VITQIYAEYFIDITFANLRVIHYCKNNILVLSSLNGIGMSLRWSH